MPLNLHLLRLFATVARTASFSRAAQLLHISQPAISKGVREATKQAVAAGVGVSIVSTATIDDQVKLGRLKLVPMRNLHIERTLWQLKSCEARAETRRHWDNSHGAKVFLIQL